MEEFQLKLFELPRPGSADFERVRDGERVRRCTSSDSYENKHSPHKSSEELLYFSCIFSLV